MIRRPVAWFTLALGLLVVGTIFWIRRPKLVVDRLAAPTLWSGLAPLPRRVTVEVLNATQGSGLARSTTVRLRESGLDVVSFGGADAGQRQLPSTTIFVRRGDTLGVGRILLLFPGAALMEAPLPSRLVDLTVVLGPDALGGSPQTP